MSWFDERYAQVDIIRRAIATLKRKPKSSFALLAAFALIALANWLPGQEELLKILPWLEQAPTVAYPLAAICFGWAVWRIWREVQPPTLPAGRERPNGIKGPMAFDPDDADLFLRLGRERELSELLGRVNDLQQGLIVVLGESGAGKTSLLRAGLMANLMCKDQKVTYWEATPHKPFTGLAHALGLAHCSTPQTLFDALVQEPQCVILNHFEQMDPETHVDIFAFIKLVQAAIPPHRVTVVVGFRREYAADWLDEVGDYTNRLSLKNFQPNQAKDVMAVLAETARFTIHENLLADLLNTTKDKKGRIAPVEIGIAMLVLCERADNHPRRQVDLKDYQFVGGSDGLLADYLRAKFDELPEADHEELLKALLQLIEADSLKRVAHGLSFEALQRDLKLPPRRLKRYLDHLASRQIRVLECIEHEGQRHYRLPHERMVPALRRLSGQLLAEEAKALDDFNVAFRAWRQDKSTRYLLSGSELRRLSRYWQQMPLGDNRTEKQTFYHKSLQRRWFQRVISSVMLIVMVFVAFLSFRKYQATLINNRLESWGLPTGLFEYQSQLDTLTLDAPINDLSWVVDAPEVLNIKSERLENLQGLDGNRLRDFHLDLSDSKVSSLAGLEKLTNLKSLTLDLSGSNVSSLAGLEKLTNLTSLTLDLSGSNVSNLAGLEKLTNLTSLTLDLRSSKVSNLAGLEKLTNLTSLTLDLSWSKVSSLAGLVRLTNLTSLTLDLSESKVRRLVAWERFPNLTSLTLKLGRSKFSSLPDLEFLTNLKSLQLSLRTFNISSLAGLEKLTNLTSLQLDLDESRVSSLADLEKLTNLTSLQLDLSSSDVSSLAGLEKLTNLTSLQLDLSRSNVSRLAGLEKLTNLTSLQLDLRRTNHTSLADLEKLTNLTSLQLVLSSSQVSSLAGLEKLTNLTSLQLNLRHTNHTSLADLEKLTNLTSLQLVLSSSQVSSLAGLEKLTNLTSLQLDLRHTNHSSLAGLEKLTNLTELHVALDHISTTMLIKADAFRSLESLFVNADITLDDLTFLSQSSVLQKLVFENTRIQSLKGMPTSVKQLNLDSDVQYSPYYF